LVIQVKRTGGFARGRANAASEFREIIGAMQDSQSILPIATVHHFIPVWNDVIDWATVMAVRDATIHATRTLQGHICIARDEREFAIMLDALSSRRVSALCARDFHKPSWFTHY
jgi:hypothetical protein